MDSLKDNDAEPTNPDLRQAIDPRRRNLTFGLLGALGGAALLKGCAPSDGSLDDGSPYDPDLFADAGSNVAALHAAASLDDYAPAGHVWGMDDTAVFQSALNDPNHVAISVPSRDYAWAGTLTCSVSGKTLHGDMLLPRPSASGVQANIRLVGSNRNFLTTYAANFRMYGLSFVGEGEAAEQTVATFRRGSNQAPDVDASIRFCQFQSVHTVVHQFGRGLDFQLNVVASSTTAVRLDWDSSYVEGALDNDRRDTAMRAFIVSNNRFHGLRMAVTNVGGNRSRIGGLVVSENLLDIGAGLFQGVLRNSVIGTNVINIGRDTAIQLEAGSENAVIGPLTITGVNVAPESGSTLGAVRAPNTAIKCLGSMKNITWAPLAIKATRRDAIQIAGGTQFHHFQSLSFDDVCIDNQAGGTSSPVAVWDTTAVISVGHVIAHMASMAGNSAVFRFSGTGTKRLTVLSAPMFDTGDLSISNGVALTVGTVHLTTPWAPKLPIYSGEAAAQQAGLPAQRLYRTPTGEVRQKL